MSVSERLTNAAEGLDAVRHALEDYNAAPSFGRMKTAIRNFAEQGRSVTWTLERLKSELPPEEWAAWWASATTELREDPIAQFFYRIRNPIIKGGSLKTERGLHIHNLRMNLDSGPPGTVGMGVTSDGPVYVMDDGSEVPIPEPPGAITRLMTLAGLLPEFENHEIGPLMQRHFEILERLVTAASVRFAR